MEINKVYHGDCLNVIKNIADNTIDAIVTDPPYGLSFMGKKWDYDVPSVEIWIECLRVLKPGGYLLSFAGTRTQHRMACRIEDAGFEIRDMIAWVYGSGFPKSMNIGKAVYKMQSNSEWDGWGTALKPALEPITMARKPLSEKTIAENCLKWGTGGINIDDCRVPFKSDSDFKSATFGRGTDILGGNYVGSTHSTGEVNIEANPLGRFPANLIHDGSDEVISLFPESKGQCGDLVNQTKQTKSPNDIYGTMPPRFDMLKRNDIGSAARFFYCAKTSKSERNIGCEDLEEQRHSDRSSDDKVGGDNPRNITNTPQKNFHPTVKPIALMQYLIKIVSRDNSLILDPFGGSGTTALACLNINRNYILIEKELQYINIIKSRISGLNKKEVSIPTEKYTQTELEF